MESRRDRALPVEQRDIHGACPNGNRPCLGLIGQPRVGYGCSGISVIGWFTLFRDDGFAFLVDAVPGYTEGFGEYLLGGDRNQKAGSRSRHGGQFDKLRGFADVLRLDADCTE